MFVELIINSNVKNLNKTFDYKVPVFLENKVQIGTRVVVPFGKGSKTEDGFVIAIKDTSSYECKEILRISDQEAISKEKIELARLMARKYFCNVSDCIRLMLQPGTTNKQEENRVKVKTGNFVYLNKTKDEIKDEINENKIKSEKHIKVLNYLFNNERVYISDLEKNTGISKAVFKTLEKNGYIKIVEENIFRNPFINKDIQSDKKKELTSEQQKCFDEIEKAIKKDEFQKFLIYGVTGSGKTEIYLQAIERVLEKNKTAIVLVPEISLTPQMVDRFLARFGDIIAVLHSKLSNGERFDEWKKIETGEKRIVIGARSAIFAPVKDLGIIIIDEEHDMSYKSETNPRYNAKELAGFMAKNNNCPLVLGSATPDIVTFTHARNNDYKLFVLKNRANNKSLPAVEIVDMRNELAIGNRSMLSLKLQEELKNNIKNHKQTILFLNRRGFSTFIMCRDCGWVAKCKNCNISLTYHMSENKLKCHYCGYEEKVVSKCPECGSDKVKYFGTGTQKLEKEIENLYPNARTIRMDLDTVSKKNSHEEILNKFKNENIDILIGTQMVVKGHHFPNVTLVGVISADGSLNQEDYRASERTFQTLVQVAGRSGREEKGKVIIQTYNPDNYVIIDSQKQDYDLFYNQELNLRKMLNYPPFCNIILISFSGKNLHNINKLSGIVYERLSSINDNDFTIYNPVPAPVDKIKGDYRWRIIVKSKKMTNKVLDIINFAINDERVNKVKDTKIIVDINPNSMI